MKCSLIFLLFFSGNNVVEAGGDPLIGRTKAIICIGCHGSDGNNNNSTYPILAGQGETYLIKQLTDFKNGKRQEDHMSSMVEALSMHDIPHVAAFFAVQQRQPTSLNNSETEAGRLIYNKGMLLKGVAACVNCHGKHGSGNNAVGYPSLAGQHADYLIKMLTQFRDGSRHNDSQKIMRNNAFKLSDDNIKALAVYLSALR